MSLSRTLASGVHLFPFPLVARSPRGGGGVDCMIVRPEATTMARGRTRRLTPRPSSRRCLLLFGRAEEAPTHRTRPPRRDWSALPRHCGGRREALQATTLREGRASRLRLCVACWMLYRCYNRRSGLSLTAEAGLQPPKRAYNRRSGLIDAGIGFWLQGTRSATTRCSTTVTLACAVAAVRAYRGRMRI